MSRSPTYPTSSSNEPLDVLIVGGGLCGLAVAIAVALSGHRATVFEAFENVHPFGSGVQLSPNGTKLLSAWGLGSILDGMLTTPRALRIRNLNGEILADRSDYAEDILRRYLSPMWTLHRVDLQRGLTRRATDLGAEIQYSSRVVDIDSSNTTITFANGENRQGDLVVVANGTWSTLRRAVVGQDSIPRAVGYTAYRITVDRRLVQDREILDLMSSTQSQLWIDQESYAHCFPIRMGGQLSVLLITTTNIFSGNESASRSAVEELQKLAEGWDPLLKAIFTAAQRVNKWQLVHVSPPPTIISPEAKCLLAGDCCHSLHPFLSQGLNLGLEDAATLGQLLSHVDYPRQLPEAITLYDGLRTKRARKLDMETWVQVGKLRHVDGGLKRLHADAGEGSDKVQDWFSLIEKEWIWSYDAFMEAEEAHTKKPF